MYGNWVYIDDITCIGVIGVIEHIRIHTSENPSRMCTGQMHLLISGLEIFDHFQNLVIL